MTKPSIFLGMVNDADIHALLSECLTHHGFDVLDFTLDTQTFRYPNLWVRIKTKFKQTVLGNRDAKKELMVEVKSKQLTTKLADFPAFDYALFIRSDIYPNTFIREIKNKSCVTVNYQWDGLDRFPSIKSQIGLFDRFYIFDPDDLVRNDPRLLPTTNFYFDHLPPIDTIQTKAPVLYFIGAHREDRIPTIRRFCRYAEQVGWQLDFQIVYYDNPQQFSPLYDNSNITFRQRTSYRENLENARRCSVLVDFVISTHSGLSLRVFEALGHRKKLITTNADIKNYDF